ncbi:MAG TPA: HEXXH motif-containing putative peptide modification protein, partial [Pseudonocardia sp.]
ALERALPTGRQRGPETTASCYPGLVAEAHRVRSPAVASADSPPADQHLRAVLERAERSDQRALAAAIPGWPVDLAPEEPHLTGSIQRVLAQIPPKPGAEPMLASADWSEPAPATVRAASALIGAVWPEMFQEMSVVVRQLALLSGPSANGFTDFTTHGVIYLNRSRCQDSDDGLPARWRLAETLVHETTHNRCNGASLTARFLRDPDDQTRVSTPLRADPRPLAGLFQQIVVLARCVQFYDRGIAHGADEREPRRAGTALRARRDTLLAQGTRGVATAQRHAADLSPTGARIVDEAAALLRGAAAARAAVSS